MDPRSQARFIVDTLHQAGYIAYYAGGWVRDYLLQLPSDDIDIATNAPPETIQALFPKTVPVGIAFGILLVIIDHHAFEVATFRRDLDYTDGRRPTQIEFATPIEDAKRRDFTINGMFYNPLSKEVIDYVGGQEDLKKKVIRAIGDPHQRIKEDRLRMIRAIRLACRFGFTIDLSTSAAIRAHAKELFPAVAIERIYQEFTKANQFHALAPMLKSLYEHELLGPIFPGLSNPDFAPLFLYPPNTPTIAYIASIVPSLGTLKLSKEETEFAAFYLNARAIHPREPIQWARLYADPRWPLVFPLLIAHGASSSEHETRQKELSFPIAVLKSGRPLVNAADLLARDLPPSPLIGQLLQQAEELMANERLYTKEALLSRLFQK